MSSVSNVAPKTEWSYVCSSDHLVANSGVAALVNGRQLALFYLPNESPSVYALDNFDPFSKANVLSRGIIGDIKDQLVVASPMYKQHFRLVDGVCIEDAETTVGVYPVRLDGDKVWIAA